jgi:predicted RND superfamily exporter protein
MSRDALGRAVDFVTDHNRLTLLVVLVLTGVVVAGIPQLDTASQASPDADSFENLDRVQAAEYIEANYSQGERRNATAATVYVHDESGNVLSKESLLAGLRYQRAVRENASVGAALHDDGMVGFANLVATRAAGTPNPTLAEQIAALESASEAEVETLVAETLAEDPRATRFLPEDHDLQSTTAHDRRIVVTLDSGVPADTREAATAALHETATDRSASGFFTLGDHAFGEYNAHFVTQMVQMVVPIALLLILLVLAFAYRDPVDVAVGMLGVGLSVVWTFGIMGWLGVAAGVVSIIPVVLITGLSVDFSFHVFNRYREERGATGEIRASMNRGLAFVATALLLVAATAAIGFLANLANPLAVIRNLGVSITLGVVSALVLFTTAVPALKISIDGCLERVGIDRHKQALGRGQYLRPVLGTSVALARRAAPIVVLLAVAGGVAGGVAWAELPQEEFTGSDAEVAEWKGDLPEPLGWDTHPYQARSDHVQSTYEPAGAGASYRSRILVEGTVTADDTLEDVHAGVREYQRERILLESGRTGPVTSPVTAMHVVARENDSFAAVLRGADTDGNGVPDTNLTAVYDAFYAADSDVAGRVIERTPEGYRSLLVTVTLDTGDRHDRAEYVPTLEAGAGTMADGGDRSTTLAGEFALTQAVLDELQSGVLLTMVIALAATVVAMGVVFRLMHGSATLGVLVAVPIALVVGFVISGMYLLAIPLNLLTALLMSLVIGLGIDYNIHLGDRYADERAAGKGRYEALDLAVTGTGGALLGSTLTSIGAFTTLLLVPNPGIQAFGTIVVLALSMAFLACVLVLPSILALWSRVGSFGLTPEAGRPPESTAVQDGAVSQD